MILDPRRTLLGVVQGAHLREYAYTQTAIREAVRDVVAELETRQPPPGTTQEEMMTKKFWSGPEIFVVIDDAGIWPVMDNPLAALGHARRSTPATPGCTYLRARPSRTGTRSRSAARCSARCGRR